MNNNYNKIGFTLLLGLFAAHAHAADPAAGKAKAAACQGCHGAAGISSNPQQPNLAGLNAFYIENQLNNFKAGSRDNPVMKAIAAGLSKEEIENLAAYFAGLPAGSAGGDAALAAAGKDKVAMCMGCHGEKLHGQGHVPGLAGQQPTYLDKQLHDFKAGTRQAGPMSAIAKSLADGDIKEMTAYLGSLK